MSRHFPAFDCPDAAVTQAAAWAIKRSGGHLRVDPESPPADWDEVETAALIEDARLWHRVKTDRVFDPIDFLRRLLGGLWGARIDGAGRRLEIAPRMPEGWRTMAVRRLRAHRALLDIEARARAEWLTIKCALVFGPPLVVSVTLPEPEAVARITIDETPIEGRRAIFTLQDEHEVVLFRG